MRAPHTFFHSVRASTYRKKRCHNTHRTLITKNFLMAPQRLRPNFLEFDDDTDTSSHYESDENENENNAPHLFNFSDTDDDHDGDNDDDIILPRPPRFTNYVQQLQQLRLPNFTAHALQTVIDMVRRIRMRFLQMEFHTLMTDLQSIQEATVRGEQLHINVLHELINAFSDLQNPDNVHEYIDRPLSDATIGVLRHTHIDYSDDAEDINQQLALFRVYFTAVEASEFSAVNAP